MCIKEGSGFMCETSGSCAVSRQSNILKRYPQQPKEKKDEVAEAKISEPKKFIDETKKICLYA